MALTGVRAYTSGVGLDVAVRLRRPPRGELRHLFDLLDGAGPDSRLLLGVEFADGAGRRASAAGGGGPTTLDRCW